MEEYETILLVKPEVFVYRIPPRATNRGYRAADWKLDVPDWTGRMRVVCKGKKCFIKLEDKFTGELFAKSPVDKYPGIAVEAVMDSSRYFVLRIEDDNGRSAFIGIGFADRGDSFDFNVALQEHFKWLQKSEEIEEQIVSSDKTNLDLRFKEGQTITINMNIGKKSGSSKPRPRATLGGTPGLLPPPPSGVKTSQAAASKTTPVSLPMSKSSAVTPKPENNLLLDLELPLQTSQQGQDKQPAGDSNETSTSHAELWSDFASFASDPQQQNTSNPNDNWVNF